MPDLITPELNSDFSAGLEADPKWAAVEKIAGSEGFRRSPRLREFLFYVAAQQLNGHPEEITEQIVGHRVYHRSENYNPTEDNIVRVSARQLHAKLREYYELEGIHDSWIVDIPKGGYVPQFRQRKQVPIEESPPVSPAREEQIIPKRKFPLGPISISVALAALVAIWIVLHPSPHAAAVNSLNPSGIPDVNLVTQVFDRLTGPVQVIISDSSLSMIQSIAHRRFTLDEYTSQSYRQPPPNIRSDAEAMRAWAAVAGRQLVNLGDVGACNQFSKALAGSGNTAGVIMSSAQNVRPRDFRTGNFIFLGSSSSNPWVQIFSDNRFNFRFVEAPPNNRLAIRNTHPGAGEPELYPQLDHSNQGYARIALVPNLTNTGKVLLIAGTSMESTEAATNFSLDARSLRTLLAALHVGKSDQIPSFEALLRTWEQSGIGINAELITVRTLTPGQ